MMWRPQLIAHHSWMLNLQTQGADSKTIRIHRITGTLMTRHLKRAWLDCPLQIALPHLLVFLTEVHSHKHFHGTSHMLNPLLIRERRTIQETKTRILVAWMKKLVPKIRKVWLLGTIWGCQLKMQYLLSRPKERRGLKTERLS